MKISYSIYRVSARPLVITLELGAEGEAATVAEPVAESSKASASFWEVLAIAGVLKASFSRLFIPALHVADCRTPVAKDILDQVSAQERDIECRWDI